MNSVKFPTNKLLEQRLLGGKLPEVLAKKPSANLTIHWLGQAGFALRSIDGTVVLIDPYLSDSLAIKYSGKLFPHIRLQVPPIQTSEIPRVDFILITHGHSDHMDPGTIPGLALQHPKAQFIVPARELELAIARGVPANRVIGAFGDDTIGLINGLCVHAVPSAHENLDLGPNGSRYLGYVIEMHGERIYHSGDCVPYSGLTERLNSLRPTIALLPVNGRDEFRLHNGVPGNMSLNEALELCESSKIPQMIAHHWGMFSFNTVSEAELMSQQTSYTGPVTWYIPSLISSLQSKN